MDTKGISGCRRSRRDDKGGRRRTNRSSDHASSGARKPIRTRCRREARGPIRSSNAAAGERAQPSGCHASIIASQQRRDALSSIGTRRSRPSSARVQWISRSGTGGGMPALPAGIVRPGAGRVMFRRSARRGRSLRAAASQRTPARSRQSERSHRSRARLLRVALRGRTTQPVQCRGIKLAQSNLHDGLIRRSILRVNSGSMKGLERLAQLLRCSRIEQVDQSVPPQAATPVDARTTPAVPESPLRLETTGAHVCNIVATRFNPTPVAGPTVCRQPPEVGAGWFTDHVRICAGGAQQCAFLP